MTKRYTGGVVSSAVPTVNAAGASGVYLLSQQADAAAKNNWPPFKVEKSVRLRNSNTGYFYKTPAAAGNRTTWTYSCWVKRGSIQSYNSGAYQAFLSYPTDGSNEDQLGFGALNDDVSYFYVYTGGYVGRLITTQVFRDVSAWYHLTFVWDTTNATSGDRMRLYVNGTRVTAFSTASYPSQNALSNINKAAQQNIGRYNTSGTVDGYLAEINFIDGQALTPSSFGATDKDGNWSPIAYTGTYGQNGFYLNFKDATSTTTIGYDYSGNGNHWTSSGISVTAGATNDSLQDVPSDQAGSNSRGNYCTLNPLHYAMGGANYYTISNANQRITGTSASNSGGTIGTMASATGKFYYEVNMTGVDASGYVTVGACDVDQYSGLTPYNYLGYGSKSYGYFSSGTKTNNNGTSAYGATFTTGDVVGVAIDCDNGAIYFSKNGTWQNSGVPTSGATKTGAAYTWTAGSQKMIPQIDVYRTGSIADTNFGQRDFSYTPPADYKTFCTTNLPEPTIKSPNKHFDVVTYTGDGTTSKTVSGLNFQPDWVWIKSRSQGYRHSVFDAVRGFGQHLQPSFTDAENTVGTSVGTSFFLGATSTGFTVGQPTSGTYSGNLGTNENGTTFVGWNWNAGGSTVTNTTGSISAQVRANPTAGFSVVTYTATAADPITVGHGLGVAPNMFFVKSRSAAGTDWFVYHSSLGATKNLRLNGYAAAATATNVWNDTAPTSSVITTSNAINTNGVTYVAYCFAQIAGFSNFGSYVGNGLADGTFIYTGFRPRYVMIKASSTGGAGYDWFIHDTARDTYNACTLDLEANLSLSENQYGAEQDFLSNGFKLRNTGGGTNQSGVTYIYAAFAETPFKYARSR